jgi:hypothetical protein
MVWYVNQRVRTVIEHVNERFEDDVGIEITRRRQLADIRAGAVIII